MSGEKPWSESMQKLNEETLQHEMGQGVLFQGECEGCPYFSPNGGCSIDGWMKSGC